MRRLAPDPAGHTRHREQVALVRRIDEHPSAKHGPVVAPDRLDARPVPAHGCEAAAALHRHPRFPHHLPQHGGADGRLVEPPLVVVDAPRPGPLGLEILLPRLKRPRRGVVVVRLDAPVELSRQAPDGRRDAEVGPPEPAGGHATDVPGWFEHRRRRPCPHGRDRRDDPASRAAVDDHIVSIGLVVGGRTGSCHADSGCARRWTGAGSSSPS